MLQISIIPFAPLSIKYPLWGVNLEVEGGPLKLLADHLNWSRLLHFDYGMNVFDGGINPPLYFVNIVDF